MMKVTNHLARKEFNVRINGEVKKYQIVPEFCSKLRANIYFWENLTEFAIGFILLILKLYLDVINILQMYF